MPPVVVGITRNGSQAEPIGVIVHTKGVRIRSEGDWFVYRPDLGHCALEIAPMHYRDQATLVFDCPPGVKEFEFSVMATFAMQRSDYVVELTQGLEPSAKFVYWQSSPSVVASGPVQPSGVPVATRRFRTDVPCGFVQWTSTEREIDGEWESAVAR